MSTTPNTVQSTAAAAPLAPSRGVSQERAATLQLNRKTRGIIIRQIFLQAFLLLVTATVLFPVLWIISMAVDPRGITRPTDLTLIPPNATLDAFVRVLTQPFSNVLPLYFGDLLMNSLFVALGVSLATVTLGASAAYAFSRFRFIGRQAGMLGFIILLMLPTTGVLIPLYVIFNAIQVNSTLALAVPSFFVGLLFASVIWAVFNVARSWANPDPERWVNPGPLPVTLAVALVALLMIFVTFFALFQRSPLYNDVIGEPLAAFEAQFAEAKADYDQRVQSVAQRDETASRREARAAAAQADVEWLQGFAGQVNPLSSADEIRPLLQPEIEARQALYAADPGDAEDDLTLQALLAAAAALDTSVEDLKTTLAAGIDTVRADAADVLEGAQTARANADEAAANLATAEQTLADARAAIDNQASGILALRNNVMLAVLPQVLLSWLAALAGAAGVWLLCRALRPIVEPKTLVNILLYALLAAVIIGIGWNTLQARVAAEGGLGGSTQALRTTLLGLALAFASGGLPFAIWNLKGYFDTIPKELEEAALIDGAGLVGTFIRVMLPLSLPAFAIVILFSFMQGWTEFILSWVMLTGETHNYTLAMALATLTNGANQAPPDMQKFAAMSILISLPVIVLFFAFQRWIVSGLSIGGVKG